MQKNIIFEENTNNASTKEKVFTYDEAYNSSLKYFNDSEIAAKTFLDKYALRNNNGEILEDTPDKLHRRLAKEFARIEKKKFKNPLTEEEIYQDLKDFSCIIAQGSPMYGIGNPYQIVSYSNCFVIPPVEDSYGGIFKYDEQLAQISKRRGGVGGDVYKLRPVGARTKNAARTSTGKIQFMSRFSNTIREVGQNGRRGAEMITTSIHHPETVKVWDVEKMGPPIETYVDTEDDYGNPIKFKTTSDKFDPKNIDFVTCKYDKNKVTGANISIRLTDEFLTALERGEKFQQRWPVEKEEFEKRKLEGGDFFENWVDAKAAWDKIITSAWQTAEPGLLFWDSIIRESPADCYSDFGFKTVSTNPCITGDTLVYVADGRGDVSIRQLAEEGKDVDVFCFNDNGKLIVRRMRNPRITGYNKPVYKVTLDDGSTIKTTSNHKFRLRDGSYKEVKDLQNGDSLAVLIRYEAPIKEIFKKSNSNSQDYVWLNYGFKNYKSEHRVIAEHNFGKITSGHVVHHKDYNTKNNSPTNLQVMRRDEYDYLHSKDMLGGKNPMRRAKTKWSQEKWNEYSKSMSDSVSGENNGKYSGHTIENIKNHAIQLTNILKRKFTKKDWIEYAKQNNLPQSFSVWRKDSFKSPVSLANWAAIECGIEFIDTDPRLVKTLQKAIEEGYDAKIVGNEVLVTKECEYCRTNFETPYFKREISFCSRSCSNHYLNAKKKNKKRTQSINKTYSKKAEQTKEKQVEVYSRLKFDLKKEPTLKEWEKSCSEEGISFRLKTKYGFKNYEEIKESALIFNHKVVSVEFDGYEDVYNGTVDDFHNFFVGGFESKTKSGKRKSIYINNLQCGEIPLSGYDSCRLMVLNLFHFVVNPWQKNSYFDFKKFYEKAQILQRLMDDLVDLEEEAINKIIKKIKDDPEDESIKRNEIELWENILKACVNGRRTGCGITALGDAIGALGVGYSSDEGISLVDRIYKTLKFGCYRSSVDMAKELGHFSVWNHELEKENVFLNRIKNESITLDTGPHTNGVSEEISGLEIWNDMKRYGRRNIALLTTSPTGSISMLARLNKYFGTSSGIEPEFTDKSYIRKKKGNPGDDNFRTDSIDQSGDHWMHFEMFSPAIMEWMSATGETDPNKSPFNGWTANKLDWKQRVKLQATAQKHIDHSISSTVNIPNDVTVEKVKEIYETAWKENCKGITVYRDGCRTGVLVEKKDKPDKKEERIQKTNAPKRPKELPHEIHHCTSKGHRYVVSVGFLHGDPYEVFINSNHDHEGEIIVPKTVKEGVVRKEARGKYILRSQNSKGEIGEYPLNNGQCNQEMETIARFTSSNLRHGADIAFVVHTLEKIPGDMQAASKVIARVLKKYIEDGFAVTGESCPDCKTPENCQMVRQDGCVICKSCGWTKCS